MQLETLKNNMCNNLKSANVIKILFKTKNSNHQYMVFFYKNFLLRDGVIGANYDLAQSMR